MTATETGIEAVGEATLAELAEGLHGELVTPSSEQYDEARSIWNAAHDLRPAVVIRWAGVSDVIRGVDFARSEGLPLALRGGGHSIPGFSTTDGGVVLDLSPMKGIRVDPAARRVVAQAGCLWSDLDQENAGVRARADRRAGLDDRDRRVHPRRRRRLAAPSLRPDLRQPCRCRRRHGGRAAGPRQRRQSTRTCSGRCAAAAGTSGS